MLAALLTNLNPTYGYGSITPRRRPGERFVTEDEWLAAQEELTKLKASPKREQKKLTKKAVDVVKASTSPATLDAREYLEDYEGALNRLDNLEIVLAAYFVIESRRRQDDDVSAMFMLGIL